MGAKRYVSEFFTNWKEWDGPISKKLVLTAKNRTRTVGRLLTKGRGCCGNYGEPGC